MTVERNLFILSKKMRALSKAMNNLYHEILLRPVQHNCHQGAILLNQREYKVLFTTPKEGILAYITYVTDEDNTSLTTPFTEEEVRKAIFQIEHS
jgi:hypothetical protein